MPSAYMAGAPTGLEGGYSNGQQSILTRISHGRNSVQLQYWSTHRATSGNARKCCHCKNQAVCDI